MIDVSRMTIVVLTTHRVFVRLAEKAKLKNIRLGIVRSNIKRYRIAVLYLT